MRATYTSLVMAIVLGCVGGATSHAADQTILGSGFQVKDLGSGAKRSCVVKAKEKASENTIVGSPTTLGGTLTVRANGGTPSSQTFILPSAFWTGDVARGFKYNDRLFLNGAVKQVSIKKSGSGVFLMKAKLAGNSQVLNIAPPNPGTGSCALLSLGGGDAYSVRFAFGDGFIVSKGATLYQHSRVGTQGLCVALSTTTTTTTSPTTTTSATTTTATTATTTTTSPTTTTTTTLPCGDAGQPCCAGDTCTSPNSCGGGGTPNVCGCTDDGSACGESGQVCGQTINNCGQFVSCGGCPANRPTCCFDVCVCANCFCP